MENKLRLAREFHLPDETILAEFGTISVLHNHLDYIMKMLIRTLTGVSVEEARDATEHDSSSYLREQVKKIARQQFGEGSIALIKVRALMTRCRRVTDRRNSLVHGIYARDTDGEPVMSDINWSWEDLPSLERLKDLSAEIECLINEINNARLQGYLADALKYKLSFPRI